MLLPSAVDGGAVDSRSTVQEHEAGHGKGPGAEYLGPFPCKATDCIHKRLRLRLPVLGEPTQSPNSDNEERESTPHSVRKVGGLHDAPEGKSARSPLPAVWDHPGSHVKRPEIESEREDGQVEPRCHAVRTC